MILIISIVAVLGFCTSASFGTEENPFRYFSTRTAYDVVGNKREAAGNIPGCKVEQVYMVIRHGARYAGRDEIDAMENVLPFVQRAIVNNPNAGTLSHPEVKAIEKWRMKMKAKELGIAPTGEAELFNLGQRLRERLPRLLSTQMDADAIEMKCTDTDRSRVSAGSFLRGLYGSSVKSSNITAIIEDIPLEEDKLLLFLDLCQKYIRSRLTEDDFGRTQLIQFDSGPEIEQIVSYVSQKTGISEKKLNFTTVKTLYEVCRFEFAILGKSDWCSVLPKEALKLMEYRQDLKYYWRYGHGKSVNYQSACTVLKDVLQKFRDVIDRKESAKKGVFRITHSRTILPLVTRMGMFNDSWPLLSHNFKHHFHRKWRLSLINPFAANIKFLLHNCNQNYYVRTFLNEREIQLPICDSSLCSLDDIERGWEDIVESCDFDTLCEHGVREHIILEDVARMLHTFDGG